MLIASMDEVPALLQARDGRKFVCFTLDDGYVDTATNALPVFKKHNIPFTVYIATSFANHRGLLWWYLIEQLFEKADRIQYQMDGSTRDFFMRSPEQKHRVFDELARTIRNMDQTQRDGFIA